MSSIYVSAVPNLEDRHLSSRVIDEIDDPIVPLSKAVLVVSGELLAARRPRLICEGADPLDQTPAVLARKSIEFLGRRCLDQKTICGHAASNP
jgi:hypothetical protein